MKSSRAKIVRGPQLITQEEVSTINTNHTSLTIHSQVEEEATRRTGHPTTREDVVEREEDTEKSLEEDNAPREDKDTALESKISSDKPNNNNFN